MSGKERIADLRPRLHLLHAAEMLREFSHFFKPRLEEKERTHRSEMAQDFQTIIHEVRDAKLFADTGFLVSPQTEPNVVFADASQLMEAVMG